MTACAGYRASPAAGTHQRLARAAGARLYSAQDLAGADAWREPNGLAARKDSRGPSLERRGGLSAELDTDEIAPRKIDFDAPPLNESWLTSTAPSHRCRIGSHSLLHSILLLRLSVAAAERTTGRSFLRQIGPRRRSCASQYHARESIAADLGAGRHPVPSADVTLAWECSLTFFWKDLLTAASPTQGGWHEPSSRTASSLNSAWQRYCPDFAHQWPDETVPRTRSGRALRMGAPHQSGRRLQLKQPDDASASPLLDHGATRPPKMKGRRRLVPDRFT